MVDWRAAGFAMIAILLHAIVGILNERERRKSTVAYLTATRYLAPGTEYHQAGCDQLDCFRPHPDEPHPDEVKGESRGDV